MPVRKADSTADAIRHFMGDRKIDIFYSARSGEIERALRDLHIVSDTSQPGVPQNNAVVERFVQDILEGTRTALLRAGLPPCFWEYACQHYCLMENVLLGREPVAADVENTSPWEQAHGEPFLRKAHSHWCTSIHQTIRDKGRFDVEDGFCLDHWRLRRIRVIFRMPLERYLHCLVS